MKFEVMEEKRRAKVLVVDDNIANLRLSKAALAESHDVMTALSAAKMFELLEQFDPPDIILLDINMPGMDGYAAMKILKSNPKTQDIPVIFLTAKTDPESEMKGLELGAMDYVSKPFNQRLLYERVALHVTLAAQKRDLEQQLRVIDRQRTELQEFNKNLLNLVEDKTGEVLELQSVIFKTLALLMEKRDDITGGHVERTKNTVGILIDGLLAKSIYADEIVGWDRDIILMSSQLHDIGKIAIRDEILLKPGPLTKAEFEEMKKHTVYGVEIIKQIMAQTSENDFLKYAAIFAGTHHEQWSGGGYPDGLKGKDIPLLGRIMAISDVYDALRSKRPYKDPVSHEKAVKIIREGKGRLFEP
ncbi:MAG: response regulator, partial [Candidatus Accumulibacter sp.]|nr:response regulator [Accumulibacter sp.]